MLLRFLINFLVTFVAMEAIYFIGYKKVRDFITNHNTQETSPDQALLAKQRR